MTPEKNLLFASFAVQLRMVSTPDAVEATAAWSADPSIDLPSRLLERKAISPEVWRQLQQMVDNAEAEFGGDSGAALRASSADEGLCHRYHARVVGATPPGDEESTLAAPDTPAAAALPNHVVQESPGRYTGESEYARGGMGRVLLVHDVHLGRDIAMKELLPGVSHSSDTVSVEAPTPVRLSASLVSRFLQEARITGQLEHPSIVPVYELGNRPDGRLYYTMKFVRGRTLAQAIQSAGDLTERLALLTHFVDLCQAIAYAHSRGVLHRDIKPANVMVGEFGETVVLDWGLAKARDAADVHEHGFAEAMDALSTGGEEELTRTAYGQIVGTPAYMPPEQARGQLHDVDERSDVYSLGAVLYEILTSAPPHTGKTKLDVLRHLLQKSPTPIREIEPEAPPELIAICEKALHPNAARRYPQAKELAEEIIRFQSGGNVQAYAYSLRQHLQRFYRHHRTSVQIIAAAAVILISGVLYYNVRLYQSREAERAQRIATQESNAQLEEEVYASTMVAAQRYVNERNVERALEYLERAPEAMRHWEWGHLQRACLPFLAEAPHDLLKVGTANPLRCRFNDDGRLVLSKWNSGGVITIYDRDTGTYTYYSEPDQFLGFPHATDFGPEPGHFIAGLDYTTVVYYDWNRQRILRQFAIDKGWLWSFKVSANAKYAAGMAYDEDTGSRELIVWDFQSGDELHRLSLPPRPHPGYGGVPEQYKSYHIPTTYPFGLVGGFLDDGATLVFSDDDLCTFSMDTGELIRHFPCKGGVFDLDAKRGRAVYVKEDNSVGQWDLVHNEPLPDLFGSAAALDVVYGGTDQPFVGVREDRNQWSLWDATTGTLLDRHQSDTLTLVGLDIADNEPIAATLAAGSHLRFWQVGPSRVNEVVLLRTPDGRPRSHEVYAPYAWPFRSFDIAPQRDRLAILTKDNDVCLWRIPEMTLIRQWAPHEDRILELAFSPDGTLFTTTSWDGLARVWRVDTGELLQEFAPEFEEACYTAAITPDNATIALGYGERSTVDRAESLTLFYDLATGALQQRVDLEGHRINKLAYSPDGALLFAGVWGLNGSEEHSFEIYRTTDLSRPAARVNGLGWGDQIEFNAAGTHALLHGGSLSPVYFNLRDLKVEYEVPKSQAMTISFHPDGKRFVTAVHYLHQANIHRSSDGRILASLDGVLGPAFFSADGRDLYGLTRDGHMRIFHSEAWEQTEADHARPPTPENPDS